jgi:hypothetical protein
MTFTKVRGYTKGLKGKAAGAVVCALIGHSRIVTGCLGYVYCTRCEAQIADKLDGPGYSQAKECVQVGHNCPTCRANFKKMGWRDKYLTPDPFKKDVK